MIQGIIDIHSHILPGVDDGSKSMEMSLQMVDLAYSQGVRKMVATPHYYPGHKNCSPETLKAIYDKLCENIKSRHDDFGLYLGQEIYYKDAVVSLLRNQEVLTMAGTRYVLVEFPTGCGMELLYGAVRRLTQAGYLPILAHVERYQVLYQQKNGIEQLMNAGALIQVNAENFGRGLFSKEKRFCIQHMKAGNIHFLGSDCHNMAQRKPDMNLALQYASETELIENPQRMLEGILPL